MGRKNAMVSDGGEAGGKAARGEVPRAEELWRSLAENSADVILVVDRDGVIRFINRTLTGFSREKVPGTRVFDYVPAEYHQVMKRIIEEVFEKGEPGGYQIVGAGPGGASAAWYETQVFPVERGGRVMSALLVCRDVTARRRAEEEMGRAQTAAERASRVKDEFLAKMGHELRTPMSGIIGMTALLQSGDLNLRQRQYVDAVSRSARSLLAIINDVLDYASIEAGRRVVECIPFDLLFACEDAMQILASRAEEKGLEFRIYYPDDVPRRFLGDVRRIRQVLINLLDNAVKFTDRGRILLTAECTRQTGDQAQIQMRVEDSGIGIAEQDLQRIFDKFAQAQAAPASRRGGIGLGLAICKQLVEVMGGEIGVRSLPESGSTFWFALPLELQGDARGRAADSAAASPSRVLVVEDDGVNQEVTAAILRKLGCRVDVAGDGRRAVELAGENPYDLIFMDCQMPGMDGFEATAKIRRIEETRGSRARIVAMTARSPEEGRRRCLDAGMDDYVSKPAAFENFRDLLQRLGF